MEVINFQKPDTDGPAYNLAATSALEGDLDEKDIGNELDLVVDYEVSKGERLQAGFMLFNQGEYFEEQKTSKFGYLEYLSVF